MPVVVIMSVVDGIVNVTLYVTAHFGIAEIVHDHVVLGMCTHIFFVFKFCSHK